jgi:hypothetical protein
MPGRDNRIAARLSHDVAIGQAVLMRHVGDDLLRLGAGREVDHHIARVQRPATGFAGFATATGTATGAGFGFGGSMSGNERPCCSASRFAPAMVRE